MKKLQLIIALIAIVLGANAQSRSEQWDKENLKRVNKNDSTYINAVKSAQQHLPEFIALLKQKETNNCKFNIRATYSYEGHSEQLWFMVDLYEDNKFYVRLNNVPLHFKNLKLGAKMQVLPENVKDWLITKDHKIIAGNFAKADLN